MTTNGGLDSPAPALDPVAEASVSCVEGSRRCIHCSYELIGLAIAGNCPECGRPVSDSLRGLLLQFASADYIATIRRGHSLILNGIPLQIAVIVVLSVLGIAGLAGNTLFFAQGAGLLVGAIILFGYFKVTQPDPSFVGTETPTNARKIIRIAAIVQIGVSLLSLILQAMVGKGIPSLELIGALVVVSLIGFAAYLVQYSAMMSYQRWLASRVPDQWIIKRTKTYIWLLPVLATVGGILLALGPLIALVLYWNLLNRMRKHLKAIQASGKPAVLKGM